MFSVTVVFHAMDASKWEQIMNVSVCFLPAVFTRKVAVIVCRVYILLHTEMLPNEAVCEVKYIFL